MFCKSCGNELQETDEFCNKCGKSTKPEVVNDDNPAMIFSIIGFVCSFFSSIAGLVVSIIAFNKYKRQENQQYKGLSIAGIVISCIGCASAVSSVISSIFASIIYIVVAVLMSGAFLV